MTIRHTSDTDHPHVRRVTEVLAAAGMPGRVLLPRPAPSAAAAVPTPPCSGHTVFSTTYAELLELTGG